MDKDGDDLRAGGAVTTGNMAVRGTLQMGSNPLSVSGNFDASNGGAFTGSNTVTFTGAGTITKGGSNFSAVTINAPGNTYTSSGALQTTGNLTISAGTLSLNGSALAVGGSFQNAGTLRLHGSETLSPFTNDAGNGGTVLFDGMSSYSGLAGMTSFNNLTLSGAGVWTLSSPITTNGTVTLTKGTLSQKGQQISVGGNWSDRFTFRHNIYVFDN